MNEVVFYHRQTQTQCIWQAENESFHQRITDTSTESGPIIRSHDNYTLDRLVNWVLDLYTSCKLMTVLSSAFFFFFFCHWDCLNSTQSKPLLSRFQRPNLLIFSLFWHPSSELIIVRRETARDSSNPVWKLTLPILCFYFPEHLPCVTLHRCVYKNGFLLFWSCWFACLAACARSCFHLPSILASISFRINILRPKTTDL